MRFYLFLLWLSLFIACNSKKQDTSSSQIPQKIAKANFDSIANTEADEKNHPSKFLKVDNIYTKTLNGWTIKGNLACNTSMSSYQNIVLEITYFKSGEIIGKSNDTLKESIGPNSNKVFELKANKFSNADSLKVKALSAYNID